MALWYVDNAAGGANDGTSWADAWESFSAIGWGSISPGDVLYISGGAVSKTYTEFLVLDGVQGEAGNHITIKAGEDAGHSGTVHLNGGHAIEVLTGTSYVTIENFLMDAGSSWGVVGSGVVCQDITLRNIEITGNANFMIYFDHCDDLRIEDCYIHDNYESGGTVLPISIRNSAGVTITGTRCYNNDDGLGASGDADGIHIRDCTDVRIVDCDMRDNSEDQYDLEGDCTIVNCLGYGGANAAKLFGGGGYTYVLVNSAFADAIEANVITRYGADVSIYNCVVHSGGQYGFRIITDVGYTTDAVVKNTVFLENSCAYQVANPSPYTLSGESNCWYANGTANDGAAGPIPGETGSVESNPLFTDVLNRNWTLQEGSPCRDAGVVIGHPDASSDFNGTVRTGLWDIGMYDYAADLALPWFSYGDSGGT